MSEITRVERGQLQEATIERLLDERGLVEALQAVATICAEKAAHSRMGSDVQRARAWDKASLRIVKCAESADVQAVTSAEAPR